MQDSCNGGNCDSDVFADTETVDFVVDQRDEAQSSNAADEGLVAGAESAEDKIAMSGTASHCRSMLLFLSLQE